MLNISVIGGTLTLSKLMNVTGMVWSKARDFDFDHDTWTIRTYKYNILL